jgi:MFS family permease
MGTLSVRYTERLVTRFGARTLQFPGLGIMALGLLLFTQAPVSGGYLLHVLPSMVLLGTGAGMAFPALMTIAMSGVAPTEAGLASGIVNTAAQVGGALGLAVLATLSTTRSADLVKSGTPTPEALTSGYHLAFWIAAGLVVAAIAVAAAVVKPVDMPAHHGATDADLTGAEPAYAEGS